jgi:hypothetical protein
MQAMTKFKYGSQVVFSNEEYPEPIYGMVVNVAYDIGGAWVSILLPSGEVCTEMEDSGLFQFLH